MNREEAEVMASRMTYRDAVCNALKGKSIPYRKATLIKLRDLLDRIESRHLMTSCTTCGLEVHTDFDYCPRCGATIKEREEENESDN